MQGCGAVEQDGSETEVVRFEPFLLPVLRSFFHRQVQPGILASRSTSTAPIACGATVKQKAFPEKHVPVTADARPQTPSAARSFAEMCREPSPFASDRGLPDTRNGTPVRFVPGLAE